MWSGHPRIDFQNDGQAISQFDDGEGSQHEDPPCLMGKHFVPFTGNGINDATERLASGDWLAQLDR